MEDLFEVHFESTEKEFLYHTGVNRGYTNLHNKVTRCYFLSSGAKSLYSTLDSFAYGDKRECFPSQDVLKAIQGWENDKLKNHTDELREAGMIKTTRRQGRPLLYTLLLLNNAHVLKHSELLHEIQGSHNFDGDWNRALKSYKKSELCSKVIDSKNPGSYRELIYNWFGEYLNGKSMASESKPTVTRNLPNIPPQADQVGSLEEKTPKKKAKSYKDLPIGDWNTTHFIQLFGDLYKDKFGAPYMNSDFKQERSAMRHVMDLRGDNELVKTHIENYFHADYFTSRSVLGFRSGHVQQKLDEYLKFGQINSYKGSGGNKLAKLDSDEEWLRENGYLDKE